MAGLGILILPFLVWPYFPPELQIEVPKWFGLYLIGNLIFACYLGRFLHPLFSLFHAVISINVLLSGFGSYQIYPMLQWTAGVFMCLWFVQQENGMRLLVYKVIVCVGVLMSVYAFVQTQDMDFIFKYAPGIPHNLPIAMFGQTTKFGIYAALCASIALAIGWWVAFIPLAIMCVWTASSFSIASLIAGLMIWLKYKNKDLFKYTMAGGIAAMLALYFIPMFAFLFEGQGRKEVWYATLKAWIHGAPYIGFGPGSFYYLFGSNFEPQSIRDHGIFLQAHNDYVQAVFEYGSLGVACIVYALFCLFHVYRLNWWMANKQSKDVVAAQAVVAAMLVNMLGNFPAQLATPFAIGIISLAVLLKKRGSETIGL